MKLSDYVVEFIAREGAGHVFEFIGGAITHLIDSIHHRSDVECVSVHHEQTAAFAAEAYARINGRLGVAMATSGPGALNMVTGIGSCWFDSVPCLFITGQVNTYEYKFDRPVRQIGFQETDIVSVVQPLTKYAVLVTEPETIRYHLEKAVWLARNGRPGPVLLDIPMNVQRAQIDPDSLSGFTAEAEEGAHKQSAPPPAADAVTKVAELLQKARRPVILAGGGVRSACAAAELQTLVERSGVPVVTTLLGLDAIGHDNSSFFGMIGSYGNRYSNLTLANCDLLLVLGARLDSRQTGTRPDTLARAATKVHVDIDPNELNAKLKVDLALHADLKEFLQALNGEVEKIKAPDLSSWYQTINAFRDKYPTLADPAEFPGIDPNRFMEVLGGHCRPGDVVTLDVGQNQMWAAQSLSLKEGQRMLISGGMGAMGFSLPAAIGAAKVTGGRVICLNGDGGIQVNIQDLDVVAAHKLPVKVIVLNNNCLGMVRQFQDMYFGGRRQSTVIGYSCPDLCKVAEAYGIPAFTIESLDSADAVLAEALELEGPAYIEVKLEQNSCVNPKLVVNRPIEDMSPHLDRAELAEAMLIDLVDEGEVPQ